jgi:hypothetical protein
MSVDLEHLQNVQVRKSQGIISQLQNVRILNVVPTTECPKYETSQASKCPQPQTVPTTKCLEYSMSQRQHIPSLKMSQVRNDPNTNAPSLIIPTTKCPKLQNVSS